MKVDEAKKIEQTPDVDKVNKLLKEGWRIIKIFSCKENENLIRPYYILGKDEI